METASETRGGRTEMKIFPHDSGTDQVEDGKRIGANGTTVGGEEAKQSVPRMEKVYRGRPLVFQFLHFVEKRIHKMRAGGTTRRKGWIVWMKDSSSALRRWWQGLWSTNRENEEKRGTRRECL